MHKESWEVLVNKDFYITPDGQEFDNPSDFIRYLYEAYPVPNVNGYLLDPINETNYTDGLILYYRLFLHLYTEKEMAESLTNELTLEKVLNILLAGYDRICKLKVVEYKYYQLIPYYDFLLNKIGIDYRLIDMSVHLTVFDYYHTDANIDRNDMYEAAFNKIPGFVYIIHQYLAQRNHPPNVAYLFYEMFKRVKWVNHLYQKTKFLYIISRLDKFQMAIRLDLYSHKNGTSNTIVDCFDKELFYDLLDDNLLLSEPAVESGYKDMFNSPDVSDKMGETSENTTFTKIYKVSKKLSLYSTKKYTSDTANECIPLTYIYNNFIINFDLNQICIFSYTTNELLLEIDQTEIDNETIETIFKKILKFTNKYV